MTIKDVNDIINAVCPNDEDYEKPCISPKYLRQELEQLALDQEQKYFELEPTTENCESCEYYGSHHEVCNYCYKCSLWTEKEPTTKNNLAVDAVSRQEVLDLIADYDLSMGQVVKGIHALPSVTPQELIHGKCNQCKYYEGVHNVQGHAPCSYHKIGAVMWNWYCSQFESEEEE